MAIELVTGHAGEGHVSSADAGRYNAGVCGVGKYVLNTGQKFAYSIESANLIRIGTGDAVNQGRHISIPQNTYEDANILNGTQGKTRIDVITLRYSKVTRQVDGEPVTVEVATVEVVKGTEVPVGTAPEVPAVISGNIFDGATTDDMPLYHVLITDTSVTSVTAVFTVLDPLDALWTVIDEYDSTITSMANEIGDTAMGTTATTLTGAIKELVTKIGDADMGTATTVTAAIEDLYDKVEVLYEDELTARIALDRDNVTIAAGQSFVWFNAHVGLTGYRAKSIAGTRLYNATGGSNYLNCGFSFCETYWNAELQTDDLDFAIRNHGASAAKIHYRIEILYQKVR